MYCLLMDSTIVTTKIVLDDRHFDNEYTFNTRSRSSVVSEDETEPNIGLQHLEN